MTYPGSMPDRPTIDDRLAELNRVEASYRGNHAQYAELIRDTVSVARLAVREVLADRAALEEAHDRALERKDAEIARLRATSTLAEMRAKPDDDDSLVRVTFDQPAGGWRTCHLQEAYVRLREAGSDDHDLIDITVAAREGRARIAGLVSDPGHISLTLPDPAPAPLRVDPPDFDLINTHSDRPGSHRAAYVGLLIFIGMFAGIGLTTALIEVFG